jgi:hypothetical protein
MSRNRTFTYDSGLLLSDGLTAQTASGNALVGGASQILNLGGGPPSTLGGPTEYGMFEAYLVVDITAIEINTLSLYKLGWQLSDSSTFASGVVEKATFLVGNTTALDAGASTGVGRYVFMVDNSYPEGTLYQYARIYLTASGTITTGIAYRAFLAPLMGAGG